MRVKNKTIRGTLAALLGISVLYFGISCAATLCKVASQSYLAAGEERFDFLGYPMMAAAEGAACLLALLALIAVLTLRKKKKSKGESL